MRTKVMTAKNNLYKLSIKHKSEQNVGGTFLKDANYIQKKSEILISRNAKRV